MLELFEPFTPIYCYVLSVFLLIVGAFSLVYYKKSKDTTFLFNGLISFGLFYDMLITGLGYYLVDLAGFYWISIFRHVFHALTPLVMVIVLNAFRDCGKLQQKKYSKIIWSLVILLSGGAIVAAFTSPVIIVDYAGAVRLSIDKENAFFLSAWIFRSLSFGTLIPMMLGAAVTMRYKKDYNMLNATLAMSIFSGLGAMIDKELIFIFSFIGEAMLVFFYFRYAYQKYKQETVLKTEIPNEVPTEIS